MFSKELSLIVILYFCIYQTKAQNPIAEFSLPSEVCKYENIQLTNTSVNSESYFWDFCVGDLSNVPILSNSLVNPAFNRPDHITIKRENGNFYGFMASRFGQKVFRLDFGNDLNSDPIIVPLNISNEPFGRPIDVELISENGRWYGLLVDINSKIY